MGSTLFRLVIYQRPNRVLDLELIIRVSALRQNTNFESVHGEQQVGVVPGVDRCECVVPLDGSHAAWQAVLHVPEHGATKVDIVPHEPHPRVTRPALFVLVADNVFKVRIGLFSQETLNEVA